uniref:Uncharacterized protein n=1 Tax=Physcomitrium patens TaxID=3218 RepID=A0A2K1J824_PHYPA|nr:hypothetical protein PHYPA_020783 [Physcomitrium patens]
MLVSLETSKESFTEETLKDPRLVPFDRCARKVVGKVTCVSASEHINTLLFRHDEMRDGVWYMTRLRVSLELI